VYCPCAPPETYLLLLLQLIFIAVSCCQWLQTAMACTLHVLQQQQQQQQSGRSAVGKRHHSWFGQ
jgi:hypothetical protein